MKDNRTNGPVDLLDEFERESTTFFDGVLVEGVWGRETTRFAAGPVRDESFLRESTPLDWIDPSEFDRSSPSELGAQKVPDTPVSKEAGELLGRLRRGEFTDPNINLDEFDELVETRYEPHGIDTTLEDLSRLTLADALERRLDKRAEPRASQNNDAALAIASGVSRPATKAGCEELSSLLDRYRQPLPIGGSADAQMQGLLSEYLTEQPPAPHSLGCLLSDYLYPADPLSNLLRAYLSGRDDE